MDQLDRKNLREIEALNQRGGRTLSWVDLIRAGTMSAEMVAFCWAAIAGGASFLTAARPGGAGKSTVLANLLALLPPREEIVNYADPTVCDPGAPRCSLVHEIGAGPVTGYIWGDEVRRFLDLAEEGHRLASCQHADTLDELTDILQAPPLSVPSGHLGRFGLIAFIHVSGEQRRVVAVHEAASNGHRLACRWNGKKHVMEADPGPEYLRRLEAVRRILDDGEAGFEAVREKVLAEYDRW